MENFGAQVITGEVSIEDWLIAAFRAERTPRCNPRWRRQSNPLDAPLRPLNASLTYWVCLTATLAGWLMS